MVLAFRRIRFYIYSLKMDADRKTIVKRAKSLMKICNKTEDNFQCLRINKSLVEFQRSAVLSVMTKNTRAPEVRSRNSQDKISCAQGQKKFPLSRKKKEPLAPRVGKKSSEKRSVSRSQVKLSSAVHVETFQFKVKRVIVQQNKITISLYRIFLWLARAFIVIYSVFL